MNMRYNGVTMQANTIFDRLVKDLSRDERRNMLDKMGKIFLISEEPLSESEAEQDVIDFDYVFKKLGVVSRLIIFFKALITGRTREEILEERLLADIARNIQRRYPGLMDFARAVFLPSFAEEMKVLKENIFVFLPVLGRIMGPNKTDFIAFLAGLEMPETQNRLLEETDPYNQAEKFVRRNMIGIQHSVGSGAVDSPSTSELSDMELRKMMESSLEDILQFLPADGRAMMYGNMKLIQYLYTLSAFPFDRLVSAFSPVPELPPMACPAGRIKDLVTRLSEILHSMKISPSPVLIKAMFLFLDSEKTENTDYDLEEELSRQVKAAANAMENIREVNKKIPWVPIARYLSGNINYQCPAVGGGEDWHALLKQFWKSRIDQLHRLYVVKRKQEEIAQEIHHVLDPVPLVFAQNYTFETADGEIRGTYTLSLALLKTFFTGIFPGEINRYLKTLLIDGEFYKDDNRQEFADAYNVLLMAGVNLNNFEKRLASTGDTGKALVTVEEEHISAAAKQKKIRNLLKNTDLDAETLIRNVQGGFQALIRVINGILYGEIGGRYDTLSNLGYLGGKSNQTYMKGLDGVLKKSKQISALLEKIFLLESSKN